jgi:hypothetical protein
MSVTYAHPLLWYRSSTDDAALHMVTSTGDHHPSVPGRIVGWHGGTMALVFVADITTCISRDTEDNKRVWELQCSKILTDPGQQVGAVPPEQQEEWETAVRGYAAPDWARPGLGGEVYSVAIND